MKSPSTGRSLITLACFLAIGCTRFATAQTIEVLDQSHTLNRYMSAVGIGYSVHQRAAQSVHVGIPGQLSRIEFWTHRKGTEPGDLVLDIRLLQANGTPEESSSSSWGHVIIPHNQIPILSGSAPPADISPLLISVNLTPLNLHFEAGDSFAFNLDNTNPTAPGGAGNGFGVLGDFEPHDPYPAGQAYLRNDNLNGGLFYPWAVDGYPHPGPGTTVIDLGFRTYMLVPEPATLSLYILIAAAIGLSPRRVRTSPSNRIRPSQSFSCPSRQSIFWPPVNSSG
jgi:hypothetical protein